jgi:hypothetical protein
LKSYYVARHWRGELGIVWSFLVNGVTMYLVIVGAALAAGVALGTFAGGPQWHIPLLMPLFFAWFAWSLVGTTRAGIATLCDQTAHWALKLATLLVFVCLAFSVVDVAGDLAIFRDWLLALLTR